MRLLALWPFGMPTPDIFRNYLQPFGVWRFGGFPRAVGGKKRPTDEGISGLIPVREDHVRQGKEHHQCSNQVSQRRYRQGFNCLQTPP